MIAFFIFPPPGPIEQAFDGNIIAQRFVGQMLRDFQMTTAETVAFIADHVSDIWNVFDTKAVAAGPRVAGSCLKFACVPADDDRFGASLIFDAAGTAIVLKRSLIFLFLQICNRDNFLLTCNLAKVRASVACKGEMYGR
ncbi:hypothetical protein [Rhizobium mesosinicum]|uniref:Uncharacterized protein n=1 Tax=Rhizobium mesosinicum TaxID=335017 RepID=A0ABS7GVZ1_9HYPH|nr:hypothetical protein [Rhizobium mesosinicum]MBW9054104.1 hypothetical protein [Rhizobium mesosinicum]